MAGSDALRRSFFGVLTLILEGDTVPEGYTIMGGNHSKLRCLFSENNNGDNWICLLRLPEGEFSRGDTMLAEITPLTPSTIDTYKNATSFILKSGGVKVGDFKLNRTDVKTPLPEVKPYD